MILLGSETEKSKSLEGEENGHGREIIVKVMGKDKKIVKYPLMKVYGCFRRVIILRFRFI